MKKITISLIALILLCFVGKSQVPVKVAPFGSNQIERLSLSELNSVRLLPCDGVLPNYTNVTSNNGVTSQMFGDFPTFSNQAADDFVVPGTGDAVICTVGISGTGAAIPADPANLVTFEIYTDAAGLPGAMLYSESFAGTAVDPDADGIFILDLTAGPNLTGGATYWLSVFLIADAGISGQWFWDGSVANASNNYAWQNPADGFGTGCTGWIDGTTCVGGSGPNLAMDIAFNAAGMPPIINCPMDVMANTDPGVCTAQVTFSNAVAIDPEGGTVTVTQTMGPLSGSDFPLGDTIIEFTATNDDAPNETATCQFTITVIDNQPPVVTCPADITVDNDMGVCGANVSVSQPTIMDNCAGGAPVSGDTGQVALNHNTAGLIDTPVTLTGMTNTTDAMVTVNITHQGDFGTASTECFDLQGPDGSQVFFECGTSQCAVINRSFDVDMATWNGWISTFGSDLTFVLLADEQVDDGLCGGAFPDGFYQLTTNYAGVGIPMGASLINDFNGTDDASDFYPVGTTTVTWTYTDQGGNMASCTMDVTVNDIEPPTVSCIGTPGPVPGSATDAPALAIPDNDPIGVSTTITVTDAGPVLDMNVDLDISHTWVGDLIVTLESPGGTVVTLIDQMGVPASTFGCSNNDMQVTLDDEAVDPIEDECSSSPISGSYTPEQALSAFDTEEVMGDWILTVSDNAGGDTGMINSWTLNYDYDSPGIPLDIVLDANGMASIAATALATGWDDNCGPGGVTITGGVTTPPIPMTLSTLFAGGNGGSPGGAVYFDVTVGPSDITLTDLEIHTGEAGAFTMDVYAFVGTYVGNEDNAAAWGTPVAIASGTSAGANVPSPASLDVPVGLSAGTTYAMAFVLDAAHGHDYTNGDGTNQQYSNADLTIDLGSASNAPFTTPIFNPRVFNGTLNYMVGGVGSTGLIVDFTCDDLGLTDVIITATDAAGNSSTCTALVNVIDNTPPVLVCADVTIELGPDGTADIEPEDLLASSPVIYEVITISSDNGSGTEGFTDFTMNVTAAEVVSFDWDYTTPDGPAFDGFGYLLNGVFTELTDPAGANTQSGNSGPINLAAGDVFGFRSQSDDGIFGAATTTISGFVPGFVGQFDPANWTLTLNNSDGDAFFVFISGGPLSFDACGITVLAVDITEVTCADIAASPLTATVFASDASGNLAACQSMITVVDALGPEVTCPADMTVDPGPGNLFYTLPDYWADGDATATDNCTDPLTIFTQDPAAGTELSDGVYTISICSTDEYGNEGCCTFQLTVESILGNTDNELSSAISLYPNPAGEQVTIANGSNILLDNLVIFDVNGKLVNTIDLRNMGSEMMIDVSQLASGVYMVQITGEQSTTVKRLIKQ